jgi:hypothetical protein
MKVTLTVNRCGTKGVECTYAHMNYQNSKKDMFVYKSGMSFHLLKAIDIYI